MVPGIRVRPKSDPLLLSLFSFFLFLKLSRCIKSEFGGRSLPMCLLNIIGLEAKLKLVKTLKRHKLWWIGLNLVSSYIIFLGPVRGREGGSICMYTYTCMYVYMHKCIYLYVIIGVYSYDASCMQNSTSAFESTNHPLHTFAHVFCSLLSLRCLLSTRLSAFQAIVPSVCMSVQSIPIWGTSPTNEHID